MAGFEIDGERLEMPSLDSLTLRECRILYRLTEPPVVQEHFEAADPQWPEEKRREYAEERLSTMERPDFKLALAAIAYTRAHPEVSIETAERAAGSADSIAVTVALILGGDDVDPTIALSQTFPNELESASSSSALSITADTGPNSESVGTEPDTSPPHIGISG